MVTNNRLASTVEPARDNEDRVLKCTCGHELTIVLSKKSLDNLRWIIQDEIHNALEKDARPASVLDLENHNHDTAYADLDHDTHIKDYALEKHTHEEKAA